MPLVSDAWSKHFTWDAVDPIPADELTDRILLAPLRPLYKKWFRIETRGLENIPDEGGALLVRGRPRAARPRHHRMEAASTPETE